MIVEYIRYLIPADSSEQFESAYARAASASLAVAPQCVEYELARCTEAPDHYILRIVWTSADDHLHGFRGGPHFAAFFAEIKPYVTAIEEMRHYERTAVRGQGGSVPTMFDWLGGAKALERLTDVFYDHVLADEVVGPLFAHMDPAHPHHVALWLGEVFGGPSRYTAERGGYHHMITQHLGKAITEPQRRRWTNLLMDAADEVDLPSDPEFRAAFASYIEWGTRLALTNSQPGATPFTHARVPHWEWGAGITPPYRSAASKAAS
ncbi:Antibiotic biosynthesis monooxygenase [Catenulispora acidiphila DSM 44928]|uniref:Antibiotic biosynthesis monooxygenase n=1 Tax=Catenulispora acidiphila (strain DSM 44928 / JCM 14897 / NBRC 102108 / NRRL B-24433 / ID139908) TaxID=479433 RepID=C7QDF4_CATAD|nr:antibiotic biosynthesis monooxygenase [Catenulispora acidiphila]ACU72747.1 Antibiotic biosynthesis monooxygenase [Catenulispora acidiphila DSM 44928]